MNRKELLCRWKNAQIYPELFYYPVKNNEEKALIFEIEVVDTNYPVIPIQMKPIGYNYTCKCDLTVFYNLRDENGVKISPANRPELFHDLPWHLDGDNGIVKLSKVLTVTSSPYIQVDWGDGTQTHSTTYTRTITVNNETFMVDDIVYYYNPTLEHLYQQTGKYTIKINGNISCWHFNNSTYQLINDQYYIHFYLLRILQWGDLNVRSLNNFFYFLSNIEIIPRFNIAIKNIDEFSMPKIKWSQYKNVVSMSGFLQNYTYQSENNFNYFIYKDYYNWDWFGEDFFHNFPYLVDLSNSFYNHQFEFIPRFLFSHNPYIRSLRTAFQCIAEHKQHIIKYIGQGACQNLHYLIDASACFCLPSEFMYNESDNYCLRGIEIIEDSIFENCENLQGDLRFVFGGSQFDNLMLQKVGNRIFANCHQVTCVEQMFYGCVLLQSVGDNIFENCYNLKNAKRLFSDCWNLQYVGNDIFKGCYNLNNAEGLFRFAYRLHNIPDKLFYDVLSGHMSISDFYGCTSIPVYDVEWNFRPQLHEKNTIEYLQDIIVNEFNKYKDITDKLPLLYSLYPNIIDDMINWISNIKVSDIYWVIGKDLFNLSKYFKDNSSSLSIGNIYAYHYYHDESANKEYCLYWTHGEAIPFWTVVTSEKINGRIPIFGFADGNYTFQIYGETEVRQFYDNYNDIPIDGKWLKILEK